MSNFILIITLVLFSNTSVFCHEKHDEENSIVSDKSNGKVIEKQETDKFTEPLSEKKKISAAAEQYEIDFPNVLFEHFHNKLIHFPIVLALLAFVFGIMDIKSNKFEQVIPFLLLAAVISTFVALQTGFREAGEFIGKPKEWILNIHQIIGIVINLLILLWYFAYKKPEYRKYHLIIGSLVVLLIFITGFLGGILSHG